MRDKVRDKKVRVKKKGKNKASPWEERREGGKKQGIGVNRRCVAAMPATWAHD